MSHSPDTLDEESRRAVAKALDWNDPKDKRIAQLREALRKLLECHDGIERQTIEVWEQARTALRASEGA